MDKKNTTIGVLLLIGAFAFAFLGPKLSPSKTPQPVPTTNTPAVAAGAAAPAAVAAAIPAGTPSPAPETAFAAVATDTATASLLTLENDFVAVHLTNFGGAVHDVAFKRYRAKIDEAEPFVFNALHADPMLAFVDLPGLDRRTAFQLVSQSPREVVYRATFDHRIEVTRRYWLPAGPDATHDPYVVQSETTFRNLTAQSVPLPRVALSVGTAAPTDKLDNGLKLTSGYSNGSDQSFFARSKLEASSGIFGIGASEAKPFISTPGPIVWATVSNQFFAAILTPSQPGSGMLSRRVKLLPALPDDNRNAYGLTSATFFDLAPLPANGSSKLAADLYVGPKEYKRLANGDIFKADQDKVMQFGFFKFFSKILLSLMTAVHGWMPNATWAWGWAIVVTTLILKIVFVPFTLAASRSAKRMQKIQPEMQALREKFKDNPQKMQAATMELFKKHKVNPMGGCFPILITIPFFIGFFSMLQSTAELRFQPFLWAFDLSAPDTVMHLFGLPLNIMPILMGATTVIQMHLTPSPTVDNAQAKMMKIMPYFFVLICYNFSCALALYSTVNGIFTIGQQLVINRMKDTADAPAAATVAGGKPVKNVTPKKKG
jgi:YidC/Oxa1 family membrane protein insertase